MVTTRAGAVFSGRKEEVKVENLELVRVMRHCASKESCKNCPVIHAADCVNMLLTRAADALEKAEVDLLAMRGAARSFKDENAIIRDAFNKLQAEHKALLHDMKAVGADALTLCDYCKHNGTIPDDCTTEIHWKCDTCDHPCKCYNCGDVNNFEWRGIVEANEQEDQSNG